MEMGSRDRATKSLEAKKLLQARPVNRNSGGGRQLFNGPICPLRQGGQSGRFPWLPRTSIGSGRGGGCWVWGGRRWCVQVSVV